MPRVAALLNTAQVSDIMKIISSDTFIRPIYAGNAFATVKSTDTKKCITIVLCAKGYPSKYIKNSEIKNLSNILIDKNNQIFHAGTYEKNNKIYSSGGRVLNITSVSDNLTNARNQSLSNIKKINWIDGFYRKDIGWKAIKNK